MDILIVDDDPIQRHLLRQQLRLLGYTVQTAADGAQAWELLQQTPIPLVLTDWMMPVLDGPGLIQRLRAEPLTSYTYVILLTIKGARDEIVAGLDAGADDYLAKPCDPNELRARLAIGARIAELEARLRKARDTDELTGLRNRRAMVAAANVELAQIHRTGRTLSLLLLDIDYFKQVNDRFGHRAGDLALQHVAAIVAQTVRPHDIVGRWGGEELLIVLPETELASAMLVAERIRASIAALPLQLPGSIELAQTASIGVASASARVEQLDELVHQADVALYRAKAAGRNQVSALQFN